MFRLKRFVNFPGSTFLLPMFLTALIYTFFPSVLKLGIPFSSLFSKDATFFIISLLLFTAGVHTNLKEVPKVFSSIGPLLILKLVLALVFTQAALMLFPHAGVFGITAITICAVLTSCNPGMYLALLGHGITSIEKSAFSLINLLMLPFIPLLTFSFANANINYWQPLFASLLPFLLGILVGILFPSSKKMYAPMQMLLIPFLSANFGANINILHALNAIVPGLILCALYYLLSVFPLYLFDRQWNKRQGRVAISLNSIAAFSMSIPIYIAQFIPEWQPLVSASINQIAMAVIFSSFLTPFIYHKLNIKD